MAYNLRSRSTSTSAPEGSGVAHTSEGLGLSPVELAVPMSEQATAGHGPDLLGLPVVIEGSPEALQTAAMLAPTTSQAITGMEPGIGDYDEQTRTPDTMVIHSTSSVYGAGAAGPAMIAHTATTTTTTTQPDTSRDPSIVWYCAVGFNVTLD